MCGFSLSVALKRLFWRCLALLYIVKKFLLKRFTVTLATISAHAHMPKYKFQCACPVTYVYSIYIPKSQFASQVCGSRSSEAFVLALSCIAVYRKEILA